MDKDLCSNCGHWREEHYDITGASQAHLLGCHEYQGERPTPERANKKNAELIASAARIAAAKQKALEKFYAL